MEATLSVCHTVSCWCYRKHQMLYLIRISESKHCGYYFKLQGFSLKCTKRYCIIFWVVYIHKCCHEDIEIKFRLARRLDGTISFHRYYTILYYTILYYTILYYTILYYTILYTLEKRHGRNIKNACLLLTIVPKYEYCTNTENS